MEFIRKIVVLAFSLLLPFNLNVEFPIDFKEINYKEIVDIVVSSQVNSEYVNVARNKFNNQDIVGRLYIESIDIDVPLVQAEDNEYYLNHDVYKNFDNVGSIFLDYRNNIDLDTKLLIYGHNSKNIETEFKKLENFLNFDFFNNLDNRKLILESNNKISYYEISNVVITVSDFQHMKLAFTKDEWNDHIDWLNKSSLYQSTFDYDDEILIMQTCYYEPDDSYLLIIAKKIEEELY